jgi:hypothetical protein
LSSSSPTGGSPEKHPLPPDRTLQGAANRWRYELTPTADGGTRVTETFDMTRAGPVTTAVVRAAKFPERNRDGITGTLERLKKAAEADASG